MVGTPFNGRDRPELQQILGNMVNVLPIRTTIPAKGSLQDILALVRETYLGALEHGELPLNKMIEQLGIQRSPNRTPLFQAIIALNERQQGGHAGGGLPSMSPVVDEQVRRAHLACLMAWDSACAWLVQSVLSALAHVGIAVRMKTQSSVLA